MLYAMLRSPNSGSSPRRVSCVPIMDPADDRRPRRNLGDRRCIPPRRLAINVAEQGVCAYRHRIAGS
eukprot:2288515-Prorocentrum_lima.AAC.1